MSQSSPEGIILGKGSKLESVDLSINKEKVLSIKQKETLEEYIHRETKGLIEHSLRAAAMSFLRYGAKWQQERMYSEEEVLEIITKWEQQSSMKEFPEEWFEQFKKK